MGIAMVHIVVYHLRWFSTPRLHIFTKKKKEKRKKNYELFNDNFKYMAR